jgi:hypothetical protein
MGSSRVHRDPSIRSVDSLLGDRPEESFARRLIIEASGEASYGAPGADALTPL